MSNCLGLGGSNHDFAACITRNGAVAVAIEEERLSRQKYAIGTNMLLTRGRAYCLDVLGISLHDVDAIVADDTLAPGLYFPFRRRTTIIRHHLAHVAAAFYPSPFPDAAVLIVDGAGSYLADEDAVETATFAFAEGTTVHEFGKVVGHNWSRDNVATGRVYQKGDSDDSLGYMYKVVSRAIGFTHFDDGHWFHTEDGKTMGLAPYGTNRFHRALREHLTLLPEGRFSLHIKDCGLAATVDDIVARHGHGPERDRMRADLAWAAQALLEETLEHMFAHLHAVTRSARICLAGGVALNCVANGAVFPRSGFEEIFIQPAAGDAGNAIGCALYGHHTLLGHPRDRSSARPSTVQRHAYLGRKYTHAEVAAAVEQSGLPFARVADPPGIAARLLAAGQLIGWFQGASEFGPRALGHRSILADPRGADTKDVLNARVKHREAFRPFAPAVLLEHTSTYFELEVPSPYMLLVASVRPTMRAVIPAVVHVDGTARVQTVTREDNGTFYDLIEAFHRLTGVPVVLNTSFNDRGEPIVERPEEALAFFAATDLDYVILHDLVVAHDAQALDAAETLESVVEDPVVRS